MFRFIYWKIIRIFKLKNVKYKLWDNRTILINYDSIQSMWIMYNYYVDWEEFNLISKYVQPADEVFDIGSNMGFYTIWMSKFITKGKIHSFEPDSGNFEKLHKNIALNNLQAMVVANKKAVSDVNGELLFTRLFDGENHIVDQALQNYIIQKNTVSIYSQKIDSYIIEHNIPFVAYMKIDVEGFEYSVLKGANTILVNKGIDILQLEINETISNSGKGIHDILELLTHYHYRLCKYNIETNQLESTIYSTKRENYFAVSDVDKINIRLRKSAF